MNTQTTTSIFTNEDINTVYQARQQRLVHPQGEFDKQGRWYPSEAENADEFISSLRCPSRNWPYSYMTGARTKKHIKALASENPTYFARILAEAKSKLQ